MRLTTAALTLLLAGCAVPEAPPPVPAVPAVSQTVNITVQQPVPRTSDASAPVLQWDPYRAAREYSEWLARQRQSEIDEMMKGLEILSRIPPDPVQ